MVARVGARGPHMADGANYRVKASIFRAHLKWLQSEGKHQAVRAKVSPPTGRLLDTPPLASSWMESAPLDEIVEQIEALDGLAGVRRVAAMTLRDQIHPFMEPMVRGILRIIGTSPPAVYKRLGDLVKTVILDVEYQWTQSGVKSGTLNVKYPRGQNVPLRTFISGIAGFEKILVMCGAHGTVADPVRRGHNSADFKIEWK
jgi:hypothetical protein